VPKYGVIFKNVGYKPKNTLRVVLFMNEETEIEVVSNTQN
jgi:hypothetical protein